MLQGKQSELSVLTFVHKQNEDNVVGVVLGTCNPLVDTRCLHLLKAQDDFRILASPKEISL
jgi:hypothetical protein